MQRFSKRLETALQVVCLRSGEMGQYLFQCDCHFGSIQASTLLFEAPGVCKASRGRDAIYAHDFIENSDRFESVPNLQGL